MSRKLRVFAIGRSPRRDIEAQICFTIPTIERALEDMCRDQIATLAGPRSDADALCAALSFRHRDDHSAQLREDVVDITQARADGGRLRSGKGVNFPDTDLRIGALTPKDLEDLPFIAKHADLVGYSFVRHADDIVALQQHLATLDASRVGIVLKIETRHAFTELPKLLLACMRGGRFGVMIARGDLAVECGFERMAEVQEEILWICEAAHTPVIWATQVLESLAKTGMPSRAEVTDAAMSERAECVMLNKGPFVCDAVRTLDNILRRMQAHQAKKRAMLRPLHVARHVLDELSCGDVAVSP